MNFEDHKEFDQNLNDLVHLLKKMIQNLPHLPQNSMPKFPKSKNGDVQVNFCFFNFIPMSPEDFEEVDEMYEQFLAEEERAEKRQDFSKELSASDIEFLRRHGIQF